MTNPRVAVAGGGLGGLCLAQGLLRAGADVTVYERDASLAARRQGYRLHVDARAGLALQACLPPESLALFQAASRQAEAETGARRNRPLFWLYRRLARPRPPGAGVGEPGNAV